MKKTLFFKDIRDKINIFNDYHDGMIKVVLKREDYDIIWYGKDIKLAPIEFRNNKIISIQVKKSSSKDIDSIKFKFKNIKSSPCILEILLK